MINFIIVTPVFNANYLLVDTVDSIVNQIGLGKNFTITYVIADSGYSDGVERSFVDELISGKNEINGLKVHHIKYRDNSMYDGIVNAVSSFLNYDFDFFSYINSGDYYSPYALLEIVNSNKKSEKNWIIGCIGSYNESGKLYKLIEPVAYPPSLILNGMTGKLIPFIQQESTFVRFNFFKKIDFLKLSELKYAGDFFIWTSLCRQGLSPDILPVWLGGFREHEGQLSSIFSKEYRKEMKVFSKKIDLISILKGVVILVLNVLHPRVRGSKLLKWVRAWK
ncbi:glycosyltransferase [Vibrio cholerae]|nr:glycosyltransferase [Vibrio cholerae]BCN21644.1 putative glycosyltransferase [Vibrio cholerae]GIA03937.1 hypothetical protein VCSRO83_2693 [Vibrio cholerae]